MNVMEAVAERRSVRSYLDKQVPEQVLDELLESVRLAPSGNNRQNYYFFVVKDADIRAALAEAAGQPFIAQAPLLIVGVAAEPERMMRCRVPAYAVDVAIAMTGLTLAAAARGLGTCWIGSFDQDAVRAILHVPVEHLVVELMPLGYPSEVPAPRPRKSREELFFML